MIERRDLLTAGTGLVVASATAAAAQRRQIEE